jgi:hypothetical protein
MKKLVALSLSLLMFTMLVGCDLLSTIIAVKDFSGEFMTYSDLYNNTTYLTVQADTELTISDTDIEGLEPMTSNLYFMLDKNTPYTYLSQTLNDVTTESVYEQVSGFSFEYVIDGNVVTPRVPETINLPTQSDIINLDNFSISNIQNELKLADHQYELDIVLNQIIDLENFASFFDQLKIFDESLSALDAATAHVVITFSEENSAIDIVATLTDFTVTFEDTSFVTFSITNHTVMSIPADFQMPDVFSAPYMMKAVDDVSLAVKVYASNTVIAIPMVASENGWIKLELEAGTYTIVSSQFSLFSGSSVFDSSLNVIPYNTADTIQFTAETSGTYFFYLVPTADFMLDLEFQGVPLE